MGSLRSDQHCGTSTIQNIQINLLNGPSQRTIYYIIITDAYFGVEILM